MSSDLKRLISLVRTGLGFDSGVAPLQDHEESVWKLARDHKVATILSSGVLNSQTAPLLLDEARYLWQLTALRAEHYGRRCDEICADFREHGIWVTTLKGVMLARGAYPKPGQRAFRDLDLLVRPSDVSAATGLLEKSGFERVKPRGPLARAVAVTGDPIAAVVAGIDAIGYEQGDLFLELHATTLPPLYGTYPFPDPWCDEEFLVHLLFHATRHHFLYGLRHLADVAVWCRAKRPRWEYVRERLSATDLTYLAYPSWKLASEVFPEVVQEPPILQNRVLQLYTGRVRKNLAVMPDRAIDFAGSPLPFLLMKPGRMKRFLGLVHGSEAQIEYQTAGVRKRMWRFRRPFGLLWRHAPVLFRWLFW
ncbi:MAG: nucleotidyltransferase family protein [Pseudomonadota bacterium]